MNQVPVHPQTHADATDLSLAAAAGAGTVSVPRKAAAFDEAQSVARHGGAAMVLRWIALLMCVSAVGWGCSTQKNYEVLSFFFDGVPDPNAPDPATAMPVPGNVIQTASGITQYLHQPYREEKCKECHTSNDPGAIYGTKFNSSHCLTCHENVTTEEKAVHGPVLAMACLWCHDPHSSTEPHLMKGASRTVCASCHEEGTLSTSTPEHLPTNPESCLSCHYGHGPGKNLLKPKAPVDLPTAPQAPVDPAPGIAREAETPARSSAAEIDSNRAGANLH